MLVIRQAQVDAMAAHFRHRFVETMLAHLASALPERTAELGEARVRELIALGERKAAEYGITVEQDVGGLIHFMLLTAPDFDARPELSWAASLLADPGLASGEKVDRLFAEHEARLPGRAGAA